ncbi:MAG: molybdopterin molybdotransferase MoeA [Solirubrobacterales bacterium]
MKHGLKLEEAVADLMKNINLLEGEEIHLVESTGRVLDRTIYAPGNLPDADRAAMDGYAVALENDAPGTRLSVTAEYRISECPAKAITGSEAALVQTGGQLPPGTIAVVPHEKTSREKRLLTVLDPIKAGVNIRRAGEDYRLNEVLREAGQVVDAGSVGLLAAFGLEKINVVRRPRTAVFHFANNVVDWRTVPEPGYTRDVNGPMLGSLLSRDGGVLKSIEYAAGREINWIAERLAELGESADLVICTGGTYSEAGYDAVMAYEKAGISILSRNVAVQPGSHTLLGVRNGVPFISLSGNPASCMVGYFLLVRPCLLKMQHVDPEAKIVTAKCVNGYEGRFGVRRFIRGRLDFNESGWQVTVLPGQKPSMIQSLLDCNALIEVPANQPRIQPGSEVRVVVIHSSVHRGGFL